MIDAFTPRGPTLAAHSMNWDQAREYCRWAGLRLPTEAEWEYAAKGGDAQREFPWGDEPPADDDPEPRCNVEYLADGYERYSPIGTFPAGVSRWGCYDLAGGVSEWIGGGPRRYEPGSVADPHAPPDPRRRLIRGGDWEFPVEHARTSARRVDKENTFSWGVGLRVCRDDR